MRLIGLVILALSLTLAPVVAAAQPAGKAWRVGVLTTGNPHSAPPANWDGFLQGLRESGYVEGQNIAIEQRYAEGKPELFPDRAADLVRLKVDVIFARGPWAVSAAKAATRTIPIIGLDLESDPISDGFVKSLARPGGNITGMFLDLAELSGKQLQILKEIIPKLSRVAILGDSAVNASQLRELRMVARSLAVQTQALEMKSSKDLESAFEAANKGRATALIVLSNPLTLASRTQIGDMATKRRLPTMYLYRAHVDAGGLISYGPDLPGYVSALRRVCGSNLGRRQAKRVTGGAAREVRFGDQPQDRQRTWPDDPSVSASPSRRDHPVAHARSGDRPANGATSRSIAPTPSSPSAGSSIRTGTAALFRSRRPPNGRSTPRRASGTTLSAKHLRRKAAGGASGSSRCPNCRFDYLPVLGQADAAAPRRHGVEVTRFEWSNQICLVLLGLVQRADDALGKCEACFTRERALTAADFGRGTRRGGGVVKNTRDRLVR
jgi:ABC-type uncharacterized transport system substrate-binding protein